MQHVKRLSVVVLAVVLAACGGGGSADNTEAPPGGESQQYRVFTGNANQHVVLDGASTQFAVRKSDDKLVHLSSGSALNGLLFVEGGSILRDGQKIGAIVLTTGQAGQSIATLACSGPAPNLGAMTITVTSSSWTHSCASNTGGNGGDQPGSSAPEYVVWNGSSNGKAVLDGSNRRFGVNQSTKVVHDFQTNIALNGLTVQGADVYVQGGLVGVVTLAPGENSSQVAVFRCTNGSNMEITQTPGQWAYSCASNSGGGNPPTTPGGGGNQPDSGIIVRGEIIAEGYRSNGVYNLFYTRYRNTGNVAITCQSYYTYQYTRGIDLKIENLTDTTLKINPGSTEETTVADAYSNVLVKNRSSKCSQWPF